MYIGALWGKGVATVEGEGIMTLCEESRGTTLVSLALICVG